MWKQRLLSIAIAIIFVLFIGYGIEVFNPYHEPRCDRHVLDEPQCTQAGGEWENGPAVEEKIIGRGYCDFSACYQAYEVNKAKEDRIVFIVALIVGIIAVIAGFFIPHETISFGALGGGLLLIFYGTVRYWQHAQNVLKFVLLGVVLGLLIWISWKKLR